MSRRDSRPSPSSTAIPIWVAGYFEETQLAAIHPGDKADYVLMGYPAATLHGHVDSISRGIADQNADGSGVTLASVNPVFTWVRLAQRIPVRIAIEDVPADMVMAAGMTATVTVGQPTTLADDLALGLAVLDAGRPDVTTLVAGAECLTLAKVRDRS